MGSCTIWGAPSEQVKIRGYRIELGEIQAALAGLDGVEQAVAIAREDRPGDKRLVGYVTGTADPAKNAPPLVERLPGYMIPAAVVVLPSLPLTPNRKLDNGLCRHRSTRMATYRAPVTLTEEILAGIYAQVLGLERVGVDDSFFELGGDSLLAMRVIAAINTRLDTHLAVRTVFDAPSVRSLSQRLGRYASDVEVVPIQRLKEGTGVPLFCIRPAGGASWPDQPLGNYLHCPVIGIQQTLRKKKQTPSQFAIWRKTMPI